ncbi:MAG: class I SAM-dependent methyltransferase [Myxococcota bacterium]
MDDVTDLHMYGDLASWFHLLSAPADYAEEANFIVEQVQARVRSGAVERMLELGSGAGCTASHLKAYAAMTLSDLSEGMLDLSVQLNPECTHHQGDMRTLRLGETFDAVLIHDAIMYMLTIEDLTAAMTTAWVHCRPGGVAVFMPDHTAETFEAGETTHGGHDGADGRGIRYTCWDQDEDPNDGRVEAHYTYMLREPGQPMRTVYDRHVVNAFPRAVWRSCVQGVGFEVHDCVDPWERVVLFGVRPLEGD